MEWWQICLTMIGSGGCAWAAVKVEIKWICKTLDRHDDYHNHHFNTERELRKEHRQCGTN